MEKVNEVSIESVLIVPSEVTCVESLTAAVGYIRVSGKSQAEGDGPVRQRNAIADFASRGSLLIHKYFSDLGVSGTIEGLERPALVQMLSFMSANGISVLIVERMDRLARDLMVSELLVRELRSRGIKLYSVEQGMVDLCTDESDPGRVFVRQVFAAVAQYEKCALVLKLRGARERKKRETGRCEGRLPYGQNRQELLTLEVIQKMREGAKASWGSIAKALTAAGYVKRNKKKIWCGPEVKDLLDNWKLKLKKDNAKRNTSAVGAGSGATDPQPAISHCSEAGGGRFPIRYQS